MKTPEKILTAFRKEKVFLLAVHVSPDGDAIGSAVALSMALDSLGKKSFIYSSDPVPKYYRFLPGHERVLSDLRDAVALDPRSYFLTVIPRPGLRWTMFPSGARSLWTIMRRKRISGT